MFQGLPGISIVLGLGVIISKCVGAGDYEQAEFYKRKLAASFMLQMLYFQ